MPCTTLGVVPPVTCDGQVYLSWNLDVLRFTNLILNRCKFFVVPNEPYSYLTFGFPGLGGIGLMNETGLSAVGNAVGVSDGGPKGKVAWKLWSDAIKNYSNVEEVAEFFESVSRMAVPGSSLSIFFNLNSMWADASGNAAIKKKKKRHIAIKYIEETGFLVETNHHQYLDRKKSGSGDPVSQKALSGSYARLGRAYELAEKWKGKFNLEKVKRFTADHGVNYDLLKEFGIHPPKVVDDATICCHYWHHHKYMQENRVMDAIEEFAEGETLMTFIMEPIKKRIHWCPEKPCRTPYICYDVAKAFKKASEIKQKKKIPKKTDILDSKFLNNYVVKLLYWTFSSLDKLIPI
ncbi:MAG: carcinine hydrolase/isopenicillin-N N-acyltransferase family protein [Candidatus Helarchaeota archaeon]